MCVLLVLCLLGLYTLVANAAFCCTPELWEGEAMIYDRPKNFRAIELISYDNKAQRHRIDIFVDELSENRTFYQTTWIFGRPGFGNQLVFTHNKDGCTRTTRDEPFRSICVRDNHRQQLDLLVGGHLRSKLFRYTQQQLVTDVLVAEEGCVPIGGAMLEHHERQYSFDADIRFYNIRFGIGNPVIWELPANCPR